MRGRAFTGFCPDSKHQKNNSGHSGSPKTGSLDSVRLRGIGMFESIVKKVTAAVRGTLYNYIEEETRYSRIRTSPRESDRESIFFASECRPSSSGFLFRSSPGTKVFCRDIPLPSRFSYLPTGETCGAEGRALKTAGNFATRLF